LLSHEAELRRQVTNAPKASKTKWLPEPASGNGIVRSSRLMMNFLGVNADASTLLSLRLVKYSVLALANH